MTTDPAIDPNVAEPVPGRVGGVPLDPKLIEILVCPVTRTKLRYDAEAGELISDAAGLAFEVRDGIPIMLPDEARRIAFK